jgi:hypothetical protein
MRQCNSRIKSRNLASLVACVFVHVQRLMTHVDAYLVSDTEANNEIAEEYEGWIMIASESIMIGRKLLLLLRGRERGGRY